MKLLQTFLACSCLLGATQLAFSQANAPAAHTIPGYLDPATGKFTTRTAPASTPRRNDGTTVPGTDILFREDFQVNITNYDQPGTNAICSVSMYSYGDANDLYSDEASVAATPTSSGFFCDVPVLTLWTLQTPATDTVEASVSVIIYSGTAGPTIYSAGTYRSSTQSLTLAQPSAGQTVVTSVNFQL